MIGIELIGITLTGWVSLLVAVSAGIIGAVMFMLGSEKMHYVWGIFCVTVCVWAGGFFFSSQAPDIASALYWTRIEYIGVILIPFTYFHFVLELTKKSNIWLIISLYAIGLFIVYINLTTALIVSDVTYIFNELYYNHPPGPLHTYFLGFFVLLVIIAHYLGYTTYKASNDEQFRKSTRLFFFATGISFVGATMNFLSVYGLFIHPITNFTVAFAPPVIAYAMLKYKLFDVRVVTAQFLTLVLVAFAVVRLFVSNSMQEVIFNILILLVTLSVGVYLILSVRREVEQRDQIQKLADNLKVANTKLKELDKLKSQFLSIASHDLRAPLTAIRNFMSILLDGTYGKLPPAAEEGTKQVFDRSTEMAEMVDNYLNVSRIEQGRMKYDIADVDFKVTVSEAVKAFTPQATEKGLKIEYKEPQDNIILKADEPKLREVVENLINNSILYTEKGSITVSLEKKENMARFMVSDTGVGMSKETISKLFKLFSQGDDSRKYNPKSTGVGLYITKAHVEAHGGKVSAKSDGEGKGSRFIAEIPLKNN